MGGCSLLIDEEVLVRMAGVVVIGVVEVCWPAVGVTADVVVMDVSRLCGGWIAVPVEVR